MIRTDVRHGYARKLLLAAALGLGVLTALSHPGRAFASLSTTDQVAPAVAAPAAPVAPTPAPAAAPVVQTPPAPHQQRRAMRQRPMAHRPTAAKGFNDPERAARRRAFVGGVLVGIVAASRLRR
jgi:hypothetical protein